MTDVVDRKFTFQYVSIISNAPEVDTSTTTEFTFQYVSIISCSSLVICIPFEHLHSNMFLLFHFSEQLD